MKLKVFFLGLFAAAAFISCNNEIETGGDKAPNVSGIVPSTGTPTYFQLALPNSLNTYAGEDDLIGFSDEMKIQNAAVFIYDFSMANEVPENYAYITVGSMTPVVLKTTDGTKKVFVALNIGPATAPFFGTAFLPAGDTPVGEGDSFGGLFADLNKPLWALSTTSSPGWSNAAPVITTTPTSAYGLIKAFAGGTSTFASGLISLKPSEAVNSGRYYLMSNWDNEQVDDITSTPPALGTTYHSTCLFTFDPDVPKAGISTSTNSKIINVQRAVAKATMQFSTNIQLAGEVWTYVSDGNDGSKGRFTPWDATSATALGSFVAGNINKTGTVFQKFSAAPPYAVMDDNYGYINATPGHANQNAWYTNFDNTRVYGTAAIGAAGSYGFATVTSVKTAMNGNQASLEPNKYALRADTLYLTENAQEYAAGYHDNSTYLVVGGQYKPEYWISNIIQAGIETNPPNIYLNNKAVDASDPAHSGWLLGTAYAPVPYPTTIANNSTDTVYYDAVNKQFIYGKDVLEKYYAWVLKRDGANGTTVQVSGAWPAGVGAALTAAIQSDLDNDLLMPYFNGNCFYRVFIVDINAAIRQERVLVRRNHVYDVTITKILGPGIGDPNKIIVPGKPVLPADTYIELNIEIQNWHKVTQNAEVSL